MKGILIIVLIVAIVNCDFRPFKKNRGCEHKLIVAECPIRHENYFEDHQKSVGFIPDLKYQNGTGISQVKTTIQVCHRNFEVIDITWNATDSYLNSNYTQCNDPLYNQDVVEVFLGDPKNFMNEYIEIEVNPEGALFVARVTNPNNTCSGITDKLLQCDQTGVYQSATVTKHGYQANAQIPIKLITGHKKAKHLKGNFFRVDYDEQGNVDYSCWQPTLVKPACFHIPSKFGDIILV